MNEEEGEEDEEGRGGDARKEDCGAAQIWAKGGLYQGLHPLLYSSNEISIKAKSFFRQCS